MSPILTGAIIGGVVGLVAVVAIFTAKDNRFKKVMASVKEATEYAALYHYASFKRFRNSLKFFDSYGALYLIGKTVYYKAKPDEAPISFDLTVCSVQQEPDWRMMKWFSITTPAGEKYYFNSQKMGLLKNNSDETLRGFAAIKAKMNS
jgi:hypothetical protein